MKHIYVIANVIIEHNYAGRYCEYIHICIIRALKYTQKVFFQPYTAAYKLLLW